MTIGARLRGAHRWPDRQPARDVVSCGRLAGGRHPVSGEPAGEARQWRTSARV